MRCFFVLIFLFTSFACFADSYVTKSAVVNLRSGASVSHKIVGKIDSTKIVEITEITDGWGKAMVEGKSGYVLMSLLEPYEEPIQSEMTESSFMGWIYTHPKTVLLFLMVIVLVISHLALRFLENFDTLSTAIGTIGFFVLCALEYYYVYHMPNISWFVNPEIVGWFFMIVNGFCFALFFFGQYLLFIFVLTNLSWHKERNLSLTNGYLGLLVTFVLFIISLFFWNYTHLIWKWIVVVFGIFQLAQAIELFILLKDNLFKAFLISIFYMIGMASLVMLFIELIWAVLLSLFLITIVMSVTGGSGGSWYVGRVRDKYGKDWDVYRTD